MTQVALFGCTDIEVSNHLPDQDALYLTFRMVKKRFDANGRGHAITDYMSLSLHGTPRHVTDSLIEAFGTDELKDQLEKQGSEADQS